MILFFSKQIVRLPFLKIFLRQDFSVYSDSLINRADAIGGWGLKKNTRIARECALRAALPYIALEDGFLRSVEVGDSDPALSLIVDDIGVYYDANRPSLLEKFVLDGINSDEVVRTTALIESWKRNKVSKYNYARSYNGNLPEHYVLVVDQTFGDASITYGMADSSSFTRMLECAINENPDTFILLKVHPEVMLGRKKGHFDISALSGNHRIGVLGDDVHAAELIEHAESIYVVTSQMGFEGLLWGKRVRTFGMPFYAGWGLTEDELSAPDRRHPVSLECLVNAALIKYPRYVDPESGEECTPERLIEWMGLQRCMRQRFPRQLTAVGFTAWKVPIVRDFFQGSVLQFVRRVDSETAKMAVVVWGCKPLSPARSWFGFSYQGNQRLNSAPSCLIRVEDGFLRSVGLGAELIRPLSWVTDTRGIYYDVTRPSDLEHILLTVDFDEALLARAAALRTRVVSLGVTKYNVGIGTWNRPSFAGRVILVPGQVETDASIALGAPEDVCSIRRNMDLLRSVRDENPDAYVIYKPHPDVISGLRARGLDENSALAWCDEQVIDIPMGEMLDKVDEVHVITSLAGFEALLRGKRVTCYGQPFYSGWGLTEDRVPVLRRTRHLSLDALVAGALILYPTYVSRITSRFTTPERALDELLMWREHGAAKVSFWRRVKRAVLGLGRS